MEYTIYVLKSFFTNNSGGFIVGIVSSLVFLIALSRLKPRLKICGKISIENEDGMIFYGFKVINKSAFFRVYDMKVKLYSLETIPSENNEDFKYTELELRKDNNWFLNRFNRCHWFQDTFYGDKKLRKRTDYAVQFFTKENITDMVDSKKKIKFEVLAKHSLSGFSVVKTYVFSHKNDFIDGSFLSGNTAKIKQ